MTFTTGNASANSVAPIPKVTLIKLFFGRRSHPIRGGRPGRPPLLRRGRGETTPIRPAQTDAPLAGIFAARGKSLCGLGDGPGLSSYSTPRWREWGSDHRVS